MGKSRLEAFSDGVLAIILTIMVLEMKVPQGNTLESLRPLWGAFFSYLLSFVFIGIYWNNHHHVLHAAGSVTAGVLWANLHLLFWLSLIPFVTGWMGQNQFSAVPTAVYGLIMLMAGVAYKILVQAIIAADGSDSLLAKALGADRKGKVSILLLVLGTALSLYRPALALVAYALVAGIWLVPDQRIERALSGS
ncbi:MAG: TMEM175 family protein [Bryobacter sp.]|jgi:uncharacterized membrane protein|nr:TMEM175 family protein [Bryobacter sp. CoA8 C33]